MSRKKSRSAASASTAVISAPARAVTPAAVAQPEAGRAGVPSTSFRDTPLGLFLRRLFRIASSLQLAIVLLSLFTSCLILATFLESWYTDAIARALIYGTWWFIVLLFLLATNILCAALKKYPWKKHQTGFLITHTGLLVLCFGGLLDCVRSTYGQIMGCDAQSPEALAHAGQPNQSGTIYLADTHQLEFLRANPGDHKDEKVLRAMATLLNRTDRLDLSKDEIAYLGDRYTTFNIQPGSFPWYAEEDFTPDLPLGVRLLKTLAAPLPSFERELNSKATFTVKNYFPHTEVWSLHKATDDKQTTFPALRIRLKPKMMAGMRPVHVWVAGMPSLTDQLQLPLGFDLMTTKEPAFVNVFKDPPAPGDPDMGPDGQLVVAVGSGRGQRLFRFPVDRGTLPQTQRVGDTDLLLEIEKWDHVRKFLPPNPHADQEEPPEAQPAVKVRISGERGVAEFLACARTPGTAGRIQGRLPEKIALWYQPADFRWGQSRLKGALQFLLGPEGKLYFRSYGQDGLRQKGQEIDPNDREAVHDPKLKMPLSFQVSNYLPQAVAGLSLVPLNYPLSTDARSLRPGLRFVLTENGKSKEFWIRMGTARQIEMLVGDSDEHRNLYVVRYRQATREPGFQVRFNRVKEVKDEGSDRSAWFSSDITLFQTKDGKQVVSDHKLYMNHTADVGHYRLFQANFEALTDERGQRVEEPEHNLGTLMATGPVGRLLIKPRPVNASGLAVKYDPGLFISSRDWMYAGATIVVLGIATMFYMRAYFFKPRGARPAPAGDVPPAVVS